MAEARGDQPMKPYANAADVLPPELVREIQKHFYGILWIPSPDTFYLQRRDLVHALKSQGIGPKEIANLAGISLRRVYQILRDNKQDVRRLEAISGKK